MTSMLTAVWTYLQMIYNQNFTISCWISLKSVIGGQGWAESFPIMSFWGNLRDSFSFLFKAIVPVICKEKVGHIQTVWEIKSLQFCERYNHNGMLKQMLERYCMFTDVMCVWLTFCSWCVLYNHLVVYSAWNGPLIHIDQIIINQGVYFTNTVSLIIMKRSCVAKQPNRSEADYTFSEWTIHILCRTDFVYVPSKQTDKTLIIKVYDANLWAHS
jgi:hypothetical protein